MKMRLSETVFKLLVRFSMTVLGRSNENCNGHISEHQQYKF